MLIPVASVDKSCLLILYLGTSLKITLILNAGHGGVAVVSANIVSEKHTLSLYLISITVSSAAALAIYGNVTPSIFLPPTSKLILFSSIDLSSSILVIV